MDNDAVEPSGIATIRGDLIRWARCQRGLSMSKVYEMGGPSTGYQSEVENGAKLDVSRRMLKRWLEILGVSERFVRGAYPRYHQMRSAAGMLPAEAIAAARSLPLDPAWESIGSQDRARATLRVLASSGGLTPTILAYVLDVDVIIIHEWLAGQRDIPKDQVEAIAALTQLSDTEILEGVSLKQVWDTYGPTMVRAFRKGIPAGTLDRMLGGLE